MADADRAYLSQFSSEDVGISIIVAGVATDASGPVTATLTNEDSQAVLFIRTAVSVGTGAYQLTLTPDDTAVLGNYRMVWSYLLSGTQRTYESFFAIGGAQPPYDALSGDMKAIVDSVWMRLADLYDSPSGGPNLTTWAQTNFSRGRIAQLLRIAIGRLNTIAQPVTTYSLENAQFPVAKWGPLLEQLCWVETIKHLRRSYLEQPQFEGGGGISRLDRQAYFDRWGIILAEEEDNVAHQLDIFKISLMGLGRPSILVSGGAFGRYSAMNRPYLAARPRIWFASVL